MALLPLLVVMMMVKKMTEKKEKNVLKKEKNDKYRKNVKKLKKMKQAIAIITWSAGFKLVLGCLFIYVVVFERCFAGTQQSSTDMHRRKCNLFDRRIYSYRTQCLVYCEVC